MCGRFWTNQDRSQVWLNPGIVVLPPSVLRKFPDYLLAWVVAFKQDVLRIFESKVPFLVPIWALTVTEGPMFIVASVVKLQSADRVGIV